MSAGMTLSKTRTLFLEFQSKFIFFLYIYCKHDELSAMKLKS